MDREQKAQRYETIWKPHKRNSIGEKEQRGKKKESRGKEFRTKSRNEDFSNVHDLRLSCDIVSEGSCTQKYDQR